MAAIQSQVLSSYNIQVNWDDSGVDYAIRITVEDSTNTIIFDSNDPVLNYQSNINYIISLYKAGVYNITYEEWNSGTNSWDLLDAESITVLEYKPQVNWNWTSGGAENPNGNVIVSGIIDAGDGLIAGITGWGDITGTQWSDLNGTYIKTSVAVRPSGHSNGNEGMNTPEPGTFNYYLAPTGNPSLNGIAYFLAPGNKSGWFSNPEDPYLDVSVNYWRLCVGSDYPRCYFINKNATDPTVFPTTGWIPIDNTLDNSEGNVGYQFIANYDSGFTVNFTSTLLNRQDTYSYYPESLVLNNNVCPTTGSNTPSILYTLYHLINGVWQNIDDVTYDLSGWNDITSDIEDFDISFSSQEYPIKIDTVLKNCNEEIRYSTIDDLGIFILANSTTTHSEIQDKASYSIKFTFEYLDPNQPNLIITPDNNAKCDAYIYKNNEIIHIYENILPGQFYTYTFSEATSADAVYKVVYKATNPDFLNLEESLEVPFTVKEYKPTFDLPTITCLQINENASILLQNLNFNCFNNDENLHFLPSNVNLNIRYSLYYFNTNTYVWELQGNPSDTPLLNNDAIAYANANILEDDSFISEYLREKYYYGSPDTEKGLWAPNKLTMVKLVVAVTNYTTTVTKEVIFPICGTWKIRKLSCGKYRLYNYKADNVIYNLYNDLSITALAYATNTVPGLSFVDLSLPIDGIYKIVADGITQYIFNFCEVEACVLSLQKQILLDDSLCDDCKMDKVLYQKALRLIPIYETWKKLLDKDNVYDIQYLSTDANGQLAQLYDAQELYEEIKKLCSGCEDSSNKKCNC
jgi:hypothetical protein